jgi:hypothetical protein
MGVLSPSLSFVDAQVDGGSIPSLATILSALAKRALAFSFHFIPTNGAGLEAGAGRPGPAGRGNTPPPSNIRYS